MLRAMCRGESGWSRIQDLERLSDLRGSGDNLVWAEADVAALTPEDVGLVADEFDLHPLAVEDAVNPRQRPKLEPYGNHLFVVVHQLDEKDDQLEAAQIAAFVGKRYLLTLHAGAERTLEEAWRRWTDERERVRDSADLLHTLVDVVVDDYQTIADRLEERIEELEDIALSTPRAPIQRQLYSLKQQIARLRRYAAPSERALAWALEVRAGESFSQATVERFRDVHDHLMRINDQVRNVDDLVDAVLSLNRSEQAASLNEVSRKLSAWAAIFAVETVIAGVYGMNFRLIPRDQTLFGFWFALTLMAASGVALYVYFKRRGWM